MPCMSNTALPVSFQLKLLCWSDTTSLMVNHAFIWFCAFQTTNVEIGLLLERLWAKWTATKVHYLSGNRHSGGYLQWLFSQAGRAYNQIIRLLEVSLRVCHEHVSASLTTEPVFLTLVAVSS